MKSDLLEITITHCGGARVTLSELCLPDTPALVSFPARSPGQLCRHWLTGHQDIITSQWPDGGDTLCHHLGFLCRHSISDGGHRRRLMDEEGHYERWIIRDKAVMTICVAVWNDEMSRQKESIKYHYQEGVVSKDRLKSIFAVNNYIWLATCQSKSGG